MADDKPIIIIKKKGGHGGHHGGAWKVAYADFVTAMMAFFMVMWLINTASTPVKQSIASYFRKPGIFETGSGTPLLVGESGILEDGYVPPHPEDTKQAFAGKSKELLLKKSGNDSNTTGNKRITYNGETGQRDSVPDQDAAQRGFQSEEADDPSRAKNIALKELKEGEKPVIDKDADKISEIQRAKLEQAAQQIRQQLLTSPELKELIGVVDVKIEADGLNIEIMDTEKSSMFQSGSATILPQANQAFQKIAAIVGKLPNTIDIVGHTDAKPFSNRPGGFSNWELSADRANAARRLLEQSGVPAARIGSVTGRADKELKVPGDPMAAANRRITLKLRFTVPTTAPVEKATAAQDFKQHEDNFEQQKQAEQSSSRAAAEAQQQQQAAAKSTAAASSAAPDNKRHSDKIILPDSPVPTENAAPKGDKIFGDRPVVGPADPFANLE